MNRLTPESKPLTAAITGATGFIGYNLARRLISDEWKVHVIARRESQTDKLTQLSSDLVVHRYDGTFASLSSAIETARPDLVFHLASLFLAQHTSADLEQLIESNIHFGTQLIEAMATHNVFRMINTGSFWQHYNNESFDPASLYAATKQAFEAILRFYCEATTLSVITLKLFDVYGPGDERPKLFNLLRKAARKGTSLAMSPGEQLIDLVFIDDVIAAYLQAGSRLLSSPAHSHSAFAVSSGNPLPLKEVVATYGRVTGRNVPVRWGHRPYRPREVMVPWNQGAPLPGWKPAVKLKEGIRMMERGEES